MGPSPRISFVGISACSGVCWALRPGAPSLDAEDLATVVAAMATPGDFIAAVFARSSPFISRAAPLPDHVLKAVRLRAALGTRVSSWRRDQLVGLRKVAASFPPSTGPRWDVMAEFLRIAGSTDQTLRDAARQGFQLVGAIPKSGRWEPLPQPRGSMDSCLTALLAARAEERSANSWRLPSCRRGEMLEILRSEASEPKKLWLECSKAEADDQLKEWCSWMYFPVDEKSKVRGCMDPRELNQLTTLGEKCYIPGIDGVVALLQELRERLGPVSLRFCSEDWAHGFRQLALLDGDRCYLCAVAYDKDKPPAERIRVLYPGF